jgi:transposase
MGDPTHPSSVPPHDAEPVPSLDDAPRSGTRTVAEEIIPLVEETATVDKRQVVTGRVRVQTLTDTIEELAHAEVQRESVEVTRVPIDKVVETAPAIRTEGDVTILPIVEEVLVVEKRLEQVLVPKLRQLKPDAILVMDNLRPHRATAVQELLAQAGIGLIHLPRYSPEFNPIEHAWAKVKERLKTKAARTLEALEGELKPALDTITAKAARGWFKHTGYALH